MEFVKKYLLWATLGAWALGIIFCFFKATEGVGGFLVFVAIVMTIICIISKSKRKKVQAPQKKLFPPSVSQNGKRFDLSYSYDQVNIVGMEYYEDIDIIIGETVYLVPEPLNQYDNEAVSVNVMRNGAYAVVGYIPRDNRLKSMVNDFISRGEPIVAFADGKSTFAVGFYK